MNILEIIVFLLLGVFVFAGNAWISNEIIREPLHDLALAAFGTLAGMGISSIITLRSKIWVCLLASSIYRFKHIRVSAAYIFKIYVDGKYLLIKGRTIDQYQPVGGVYKRLPDSSKVFQELEILDDRKIPICDTTRNDLRIRVKGRFLHKFLLWFESNQDREISHWREFCEELIVPEILNKDVFPHIEYKFLYRNPLYIHHSTFYNCPEILIHDVYEIIPNAAQIKELKQLLDQSSNDNIRWVIEDSIMRLGYLPDNTKPFSIAEHANSLINKHFKIK